MERKIRLESINISFEILLKFHIKVKLIADYINQDILTKSNNTYRQESMNQISLDTGQRFPLNQDGKGLIFFCSHQTTEP